MFHAISWSQYGLTVLLLLLAYYAYVGAVYYRSEVRAWLGRSVEGAGRQPTAPERTAATGRPSLIIPSLVAGLSPENEAKPEAETPEISPSDEAAKALLFDEGAADAQPRTGGEAAPTEESGLSPAPEPAATESLIEVQQLSEFLNKVEAGEFTEENAEEVPAALENTALLQDIFAAGLARRRASLAVLERL
ncbi:hypothetical protein [Hymenobacter sp. HDW8]|uniref:hypothetical protein n=1 Tax=Hymenobacter sp. HDW8 TaxID=2714932 RepID=UPI00140C56A4|nr:hypothetical protein [Hymenobacter sp. HDW8]QIL78332.1 hypothetical protein G7064_21180 [Hymenobacter sp. HDW8]